MRWDDTVRFKALQPQMLLVISRAEEIYARFDTPLWITSANDRQHKEGSPHYVGKALDFRTHNLPQGHVREIYGLLVGALGPEFVVLLEDEGQANEHIHCQYQG